jgi:hypothetical protein
MVPDMTDAEKVAARRKVVREQFSKRFAATATRFRGSLEGYYGKDEAAKVGFAEAFEICEYGRRPAPEEIRKLFPFYGGK